MKVDQSVGWWRGGRKNIPGGVSSQKHEKVKASYKIILLKAVDGRFERDGEEEKDTAGGIGKWS